MTTTEHPCCPARTSDFHVFGSGSVFLLTPLSQEARRWVEEHLPEDYQTLGESIAIEHRYICDIIDGIQADGLSFTR